MSTTISWNGTTYTLPTSGESDWAALMLLFYQSLAANAATKTTAQTLTNKTLTAPTVTGVTSLGVGVLCFGNASTAADTTARYLRPFFSSAAADTTEVKIRVPAAGRVSGLYVQSSSATAGDTTVITVRKNGSDTALTCTVAAAGTQAADATNSFTVVAGDAISVKVVSGASIATGLTNPTVTMAFTQG